MTVHIAGVCRMCKCTELQPCSVDYDGERVTCGWLDRAQTLCSNPACVAKIPMRELLDICFPRLPDPEPRRKAAHA